MVQECGASNEWLYKYFFIYFQHKSSEVYSAPILSHPLTALGTGQVVLLLSLVWSYVFDACWLANISVISVFKGVKCDWFTFIALRLCSDSWSYLSVAKFWSASFSEITHRILWSSIWKGSFYIRNSYLKIMIQLNNRFWLPKYVSVLKTLMDITSALINYLMLKISHYGWLLMAGTGAGKIWFFTSSAQVGTFEDIHCLIPCGYPLSYGEGNGNPLQYSCLENPMDGGAW